MLLEDSSPSRRRVAALVALGAVVLLVGVAAFLDRAVDPPSRVVVDVLVDAAR